MEIRFCPKCKGELKPVYKDVHKEEGKYRTIDGAIALPIEWFCGSCKEMFKIVVVGIVC